MKFLAILPATLIAAAPAFAGPYANVEANSGFTGSDYSGTSTDFHVGYEGSSGVLGYYIQAGPSVISPDGGEQKPSSLVRLVVRLLQVRSLTSMVKSASLLTLLIPMAPKLV